MVDDQAGYRGLLGSPFCTTMCLYLCENNHVSDFGETNMTLDEKVKELYEQLKPKCAENNLSLEWEIHKELKKFRKEHPDLDEQWSLESLKTPAECR